METIVDGPEHSGATVLYLRADRVRRHAALLRQSTRRVHFRSLVLRRQTNVLRRACAGPVYALADSSIEAEQPRGTVLVADDDEAVRESLSDVTEMAGYRVLQAAHGTEALSVLARFDVDVVLLDINMPVLDGWGVLHGLRERPPVVIIHSGHEFTPAEMRDLMQLHLFEVVPKTTPPSYLLGAVQRAMESA